MDLSYALQRKKKMNFFYSGGHFQNSLLYVICQLLTGTSWCCWLYSLLLFNQQCRTFWTTRIPVNYYFVLSIRHKRISCKMKDNTSCGYRKHDPPKRRTMLVITQLGIISYQSDPHYQKNLFGQKQSNS